MAIASHFSKFSIDPIKHLVTTVFSVLVHLFSGFAIAFKVEKSNAPFCCRTVNTVQIIALYFCPYQVSISLVIYFSGLGQQVCIIEGIQAIDILICIASAYFDFFPITLYGYGYTAIASSPQCYSRSREFPSAFPVPGHYGPTMCFLYLFYECFRSGLFIGSLLNARYLCV